VLYEGAKQSSVDMPQSLKELAVPMQPYDSVFYDQMRELSLASAREIVPFVLRFVDVCSVVDVGCGTGAWVKTFFDFGVPDVLGIDGDYVERMELLIPQNSFCATDLSAGWFTVERRFDLAVSLEVAEHLPATAADPFVESLTQAAPVVLFSAGLPFQGGTNHINEQWPEYWWKRFKARGYEVVDFIRREFWNNSRVRPCYAQNTLLFVDSTRAQHLPRLAPLMGPHNEQQLSLVHPSIYLCHADHSRMTFRPAFRLALQAGWRALMRRVVVPITPARQKT